MSEKGLANYFEKFLTKRPMFKSKDILQESYTPENIPHREKEIESLARIIAPCLRTEKPSNVFLYGKTGTGKTLVAKHVRNQLNKIAKERDIPLKIIYLNCKLKKIADTEYRMIAELARKFGKQIPPTGLPTDEVYNIFYNVIDKEKQIVLLILDEVDRLVGKSGDEILYNLTRINSELKKSKISIIGISNNISFADLLDPRVKSSLSEEELIFPPYDALQLKEILKERADAAFAENVLEPGVIEKCAAYAAKEHGDARRALELLRVAGELAERNNEEKVKIKHIDEAENKIERDRVLDIVDSQPKQQQAVLYSILNTCANRKSIFTGEVYEFYQQICKKTGLAVLTQRRVSDIISELDMLGIINAEVISKGRYGRTREISLSTTNSVNPKIMKILEEGLRLI